VPRSNAGKIDGIEQPSPELALEAIVRQKARAVDLVFHRRFRKDACLPVVAKHLQQIVGAEIANRRFRRMRDLEIGLDAVDVLIADQVERAMPLPTAFRRAKQ
jgi:hypothetical protein